MHVSPLPPPLQTLHSSARDGGSRTRKPDQLVRSRRLVSQWTQMASSETVLQVSLNSNICLDKSVIGKRPLCTHSKTSLMDPRFGPAWVAFGHTFALEGEHDHAVTAYSTCARMFTG
jgi:hypothetical protein